MTAEWHEDAELVRCTRNGDRTAFAELVRRYGNAAYATALTYVHNREDAQDIVQDAFIAAYCKLVQLREPRQFGSWLRSIVRTRALEWLRRARTLRLAFDATEATQVELANASAKGFAAARESEELWEAVYGLPEKYREVVLMYYLNDFSYREIADFMGLRETTVNGRLSQSRMKLKGQLSPEETEGLTMNRAHVEKKVEETVAKIAREELHETIPLGDTENVVLFCGIEADIEICQAEGENVILTGSKASIGFTEEEAKKSVAGIRILSDQVENYLESGPHPGEYFWGVTEKDGKAVPITQRIPEQWKLPGEVARGTSFEPTELFPEMATWEKETVRIVKEALGRATRLTVIRERIDDVTLSPAAYTEELHRAFALKYSTQGIVYGSRGRVDLVVAIPARKTITVLSKGRDRIRAWGLRSNVNVVHGGDTEVADIEGDVCLLNTPVREAKGVRGRFFQGHYEFGATEESDDGTKIRRVGILESAIRDLTGEITLDLGRVNLTAADLHGKVTIRNRFGATRFHLNRHEQGSRYRIHADSGEVIVFLKGELSTELTVTVHTLCGHLKLDALRGTSRNRHFAQGLISSSTVTVPMPLMERDRTSDLVVTTRDGDVTIEKMI